jgi:uncharacterized coiled-coil DUF342 family protein
MAVFSDTFCRLREDLDQAHENRQKLIHDIRDGVCQMARQTADQLTEQGKSRREEFTSMITELRSKIRDQAQQTRQQLAELATDLRHGGEIFGRRQSARRHCSRKS